MATVVYNGDTGKFEVYRRGTLLSEHNTESAAVEAGRSSGVKYGEPVSYDGPGEDNTEWIHTPDADEQMRGGSVGTPNSTVGTIRGMLGF